MAAYGLKPRTFGYMHSPGTSAQAAARYTSGVASALAGGSPLAPGPRPAPVPQQPPIRLTVG